MPYISEIIYIEEILILFIYTLFYSILNIKAMN